MTALPPYFRFLSFSLCLLSGSGFATDTTTINREELVQRHNPKIDRIDPLNPFTLGNGKFAFTADVTGLQSLPDLYYAQGTPLETKARWAWHSRKNPKNFSLKDANQTYDAYGVKVNFPTNMDSEAGQWLRQNPHDLPLAQLSLYSDGKTIKATQLENIHQSLDLWEGKLRSEYTLSNKPVLVETVVHGEKDAISSKITSPMIRQGLLSVSIQFPRGYLLDKKNTPDIDWLNANEHTTTLVKSDKHSAYFLRQIDDTKHNVKLSWIGNASLEKLNSHHYTLNALESFTNKLEVSLEFSETEGGARAPNFDETIISAQEFWRSYWSNGAIISLSKSVHPKAKELERRLILSQYIMGTQSQAPIPTQETGLTSSSWYGKHHTEMTWWHNAHWVLWNRPQQAKTVLNWYQNTIPQAKTLANSRGLDGARWAKMVGPSGQESPGGNPLIIWNQPQTIHLAELLYQQGMDPSILKHYENLVEETAKAMSSMLVWEEKEKQFSLLPPIWIAQEIYPATESKNPSFELSYWRYGLSTAQEWRKRLGKKNNVLWDKQIQHLAKLPIKNGKYVAIESIPDTFDNIESRKDHPTMLAPWGLLQDPTVDPQVMKQTLAAVLKHWDWQKKIWGWDYPMLAMTALQLKDTELALNLLLKDAPHNQYLINGHCPQQGAQLPVYLPANGALLAAMAMIAKKWPMQRAQGWDIQAEGMETIYKQE